MPTAFLVVFEMTTENRPRRDVVEPDVRRATRKR